MLYFQRITTDVAVSCCGPTKSPVLSENFETFWTEGFKVHIQKQGIAQCGAGRLEEG